MRAIAVVAAAFAVIAFSPSGWSAAEPSADKRIVAAMFYSNFCASCRVLDPKIQDVKPDFADRPVDFVKFNQTFSLFNTDSLRELAEEHGVPGVFEEYRGKTGFMLLVEPETERVLAMITMSHSRDAIRAEIERALASQETSS
jgi:thiol-disulfide isomerase/thioredoxin